MSSVYKMIELYLIAENISNPTTVLENPHWDEFDRELDEGYDFVGFQLKSLHTAKVERMIKRIRGYGVGTLDTPVPYKDRWMLSRVRIV